MAIHRKLTTICAAVVLSLGLAACGGGGDEPTTAVCPAGQEGTPPNCTPIQTPYDTAKAAIAAADHGGGRSGGLRCREGRRDRRTG